jgi:hypothetical protein
LPLEVARAFFSSSSQLRKSAYTTVSTQLTTFFSKGIRIRPTGTHGIELCGSLHGFAVLLGKLILELLLIGGGRLAGLLELSLKVDNPLLLHCRILQQVRPALSHVGQRLPQHDRIVSIISTMCNQVTETHCEALTVSALLIVMMLVLTTCISSLSSNQSSCQGV